MQSKEKDNLVMARMFSGENVYDCLKALFEKHKIATAVVLSGIGQLGEFELGFFKEKGNYLIEKFGDSHELLSLNGSINYEGNNPDFHLHAVLGNIEKQVRGGHFISGKVSITLEVALLKTDLPVKRILDEETGLRGLYLP